MSTLGFSESRTRQSLGEKPADLLDLLGAEGTLLGDSLPEVAGPGDEDVAYADRFVREQSGPGRADEAEGWADDDVVLAEGVTHDVALSLSAVDELRVVTPTDEQAEVR